MILVQYWHLGWIFFPQTQGKSQLTVQINCSLTTHNKNIVTFLSPICFYEYIWNLDHKDYHLLKCDAVYFGTSVCSDILLMEAVRSSETSVFMCLTARRHIPYDSKYHSYNCHYLKYHPPDGNKFDSQIASCIQFTYRLKTYDTRLRVTITKESTPWVWWPWVTPKCKIFFFGLPMAFNSKVLHCTFASRFYILLCSYRPRTARAATSRARKNVFQDRRQWFRAPAKNSFRPPSKGGLVRICILNRKKLPLSCRVTWAWSERVNLYIRQIINNTSEKDKYVCNIIGPGPFRTAR